ncbi:MAG: DUF4434 domain-containing protein [Clostridia bacterium]|nr:DUF4434 domain-containing protein [Clostridia bacterium]
MQGKYPITGTFIDEVTYDIPASNWSNEQWAADLDHMKEVGMDTVIIMRSVFYDKCLYPSKHFAGLKEEGEDFIGFILEEAQKRDMQVFIGLYISNLTWNAGDYRGEIEKNKLFVDEVLKLYGHFSSFKGWYIPHETGSNIYNIAETMGGLAALCKENAPDKVVFISPFFRGEKVGYPDSLSPERTVDAWQSILKECGKNIDICAFQDGTVSLEEYADYLAAIKPVMDEHGIRLWANVETFERDVRTMFFPIPFDVLRRKIKIAEEYVEKCITFEFSHFLSPQSIFPSARNLNNLYRKYYESKK